MKPGQESYVITAALQILCEALHELRTAEHERRHRRACALHWSEHTGQPVRQLRAADDWSWGAWRMTMHRVRNARRMLRAALLTASEYEPALRPYAQDARRKGGA